MTFDRPRLGRTAALAATALAAGIGTADAQRVIFRPMTSPHATVSQRIGMTDVTIDYHRPSVRGREIWGGLVPFGEVWRAGANENTTFTTTDSLLVEGEELPAGTYGLHMIPSQGGWTVVFSKMADAWGSFSYDESEDALRVTVRTERNDWVEQLTYGFDDVSDTMALAYLTWEELKVPFQLEAPQEHILAAIRRQLRGLPRFTWQGWQQAAQWCLQSDVNLDEALEWAEESLERNENAQNLGTKAGILRALGRDDEANEAILAAVEHGDERQVNMLGYQLLQAKQTEQAIQVFQTNVDRHPDSWNVYDSLAEAYAAAGDNKRAIKFYKKALGMAPEQQHSRIEGVLKGLQES